MGLVSDSSKHYNETTSPMFFVEPHCRPTRHGEFNSLIEPIKYSKQKCTTKDYFRFVATILKTCTLYSTGPILISDSRNPSTKHVRLTGKHSKTPLPPKMENGWNRSGQPQIVIIRQENASVGLVHHRIKSGEVGPVVFDGLSNAKVIDPIAHSWRRRFRIGCWCVGRVFSINSNCSIALSRFQAFSSGSAADRSGFPVGPPCVQLPKSTGRSSDSRNPSWKYVHRTKNHRGKTSGLLPPRWKMVRIDWANLTQYISVEKTCPPHQEPLCKVSYVKRSSRVKLV